MPGTAQHATDTDTATAPQPPSYLGLGLGRAEWHAAARQRHGAWTKPVWRGVRPLEPRSSSNRAGHHSVAVTHEGIRAVDALRHVAFQLLPLLGHFHHAVLEEPCDCFIPAASRVELVLAACGVVRAAAHISRRCHRGDLLQLLLAAALG